MSQAIVTVEGLGKRYQLAHRSNEPKPDLRDVLTSMVSAPKRWLSSAHRAANAQTEAFWALQDVSFEVAQGEVVGIIGRNGAGKSTLLKILSRITEPTTGRVTLSGRVASLLEVGTGFHPELSGRENIHLNAAILGMTRSEIARKFDEIVAFAEVERFLDTPVKRYSSGMYVRLAFAVSAHLEPEILIVDEVLAVGDAEFQNKCIGKMHEVSKAGRTVLVVSHNVGVIAHLCSRAILLRQGRIAIDGSVNEVVSAYTAQGDRSVGTLMANIKMIHPDVTVEQFLVNDSTADLARISAEDRTVRFSMVFRTAVRHRFSLYGYLRDAAGARVGVYSPGHNTANLFARGPGTYELSGGFTLPRLTKGRYFLDLGLVEPGIQYFTEAPMAIELHVDSPATSTGQRFEQSSDNGVLILEGDVRIQDSSP